MRGVDELKEGGHLRLGTGDFIGWSYMPDKPYYGRSSDGHGITTHDDPHKAMRVAEIDLERYEEYCAYIRAWLADMEELHGGEE